MEVKVDIEKLQLLNDRINQTIDALNQVRVSTRGLSHTSAVDPWAAQQAYPQPVYASAQPMFAAPQAFVPAPIQMSGLQHTTPMAQFSPYANIAQPAFVAVPQIAGGLSHSSPNIIEQQLLAARMQDPRVLAQTFPFVTSPLGLRPSW